MSDIKELYEVRDYREGDKSFVLATFLRGLYYGDSWFSKIPKDIFMNNYKKIGEYFTTSPKSIIKVACLKEDQDVIIGYSILSANYLTIHYCFVKKAWRNHGVGRSLLPQHPVAVSHLTTLGEKLLPKFTDCVFNPFEI